MKYQVFHEMFKDVESICREFVNYDERDNWQETQPAKDLKGAKVLFAYYDCQNYSGDATVLYRKGGKIFIVGGSHCSCNGLEGQWEPKEVTVKYLKDMACNPIPDYYSGTEPVRQAWYVMVAGLREPKKVD